MKARFYFILPLIAVLAALLGDEPAPAPAGNPPAVPAPAPAVTAGTTAAPSPASPAPPPLPQGRLTPPDQPLRALQVLNLDCKDLSELDARFRAWREAGVQAVIVRVFHNPGDGYYRFVTPQAESGVYFATAHAPVVADALTPLAESAHRNRLLVIAWMTTRYADYGGGAGEGRGCMEWKPGAGVAPTRGWSVLLPEVTDRLALIFADLARGPIDGVLLQDDLILRHTEDMNPRVRAMYRAETGRSAEPDDLFSSDRGRVEYRPGFLDWRRWENRKLLAVAGRIRAAVQSVRPRVPVGLNLYYENVTDPANALVWYAQDFDATAQSDLDFYALMLYHRQVARELRLPDAEAIRLIERGLGPLLRRVDRPQRIWVKAQSVDWDTGKTLPPSQVADLLGRAKALGPLGLVIMPAPRDLNLLMVKETFQ